MFFVKSSQIIFIFFSIFLRIPNRSEKNYEVQCNSSVCFLRSDDDDDPREFFAAIDRSLMRMFFDDFWFEGRICKLGSFELIGFSFSFQTTSKNQNDISCLNKFLPVIYALILHVALIKSFSRFFLL